MDLSKIKKNPSWKYLVEMGVQGQFPLFDKHWSQELIEINDNKENNPNKILKNIVKRIDKQRSFERKKTVFFSLSEQERKLFIQAFMKSIENRMLDSDVHLH